MTINAARKSFTRLAAAATALLLAGGMISANSVAASADSLSQVGIEKTASSATAPIGTNVVYTLAADCFSTTDGCVGVSITDQLPAGMTFAGFVPSDPAASFATWNFDAATGLLTIDLVAPLPSGSTPTFSYAALISADGSVVDGDVLENTATITATNAVASDTDSASVTATYAPIGRVTSSLAWDDEDAAADGLEFSDKTSTLTVSGTNAGSRLADSLTIALPGAAGEDIFESFAVTALSGALPAGATTVELTVTLADGTILTVSPTVSGSSWTVPSLPGGAAFADIVGVTAVFTGAIGGTGVLGAPAVSAGTIALGLTQLDQTRGTSTNLITDGQNRTVTGAADVSISYSDPGIDPLTCNDCAQTPTDTYTVLYPQPRVTVTKSDYVNVAGGPLVEGQNQLVSNTITARNTSVGGIGIMEITDAQAGGPNPFADDDIDLHSLSIAFPAGAESAVVTIDLPSGAQTFPLAAAVSSWVPPLTGGAVLGDATGFSVRFSDTDGNYITTNATATVTVFSTVNDSVTVASPGVGNSATATVTSAILPAASGVAIQHSGATAPLIVTKPTYALTLSKRISNPFMYLGSGNSTQFRHTVTVGQATAIDRVVIQDPIDPLATDNPFRAFDATEIVDLVVPADATLNVSYFDDVTGTWLAVPGFTGLTGAVNSAMPATVAEHALGIRFEYIAATSFAPGRTFGGNIKAVLRTTDRVSGDAAELGSFANCSAAWSGDNPDADGEAGPEQAYVELAGLECPKVTVGPPPTGGGSIDKDTPYKSVKEQSVVRGVVTDEADSLVVSNVVLLVNKDNSTSISIEDSAQTAENWWKVFNIDRITTVPFGPLLGASPTAGGVRLTQFQKADIHWLDASGAQLGVTTITGTGVDQASGTIFDVNAATAIVAAGLTVDQVAGFRVTFSEVVDGAGAPLAGDPEPGQLENAFFGQYGSIRGVQLGLQFQVRSTERGTTTPVLDENCYGVDADVNGTVDCDPSVVDYEPLNSGTGDEGWVNNFAEGTIAYVADPTWTGGSDGDTSAAHIIEATVDVNSTTTFARIVDATTTAPDMGVPASGTPAADYPLARLVATSTLAREVPVDSLVVSIPQVTPTMCPPTGSGPACLIPVPTTPLASSDPASPFDFFDLKSVTITGAPSIGLISATVGFASGAPVTLGPLSAADLSAAINALPNLADVTSLVVTALPAAGHSGIAVSSVLTVTATTQLRETVRSTGESMSDFIEDGTHGVGVSTLASALDVVANDHASSRASILLRSAGVGVSATKSFTPRSGNIDQLPTSQVLITVRNSGEVPVDSLIVRDIDDSAGISDTWNSFDLASIDSVKAPRSNGVVAADTLCLKIVTWSTPGTGVEAPCITSTVAADGTFPVDLSSVDVSTVRGLVFEFTNASGAKVPTWRVAGDEASVLFSLTLRAMTVSPVAKVTTAPITNSAVVGVTLSGATTVETASDVFTPLLGTPSVDVQKFNRNASTGLFDGVAALAQSGDVVEYALIVRNTGTTTMVDPVVADLPPAQLLLTPSPNSGFDVDRIVDGVEVWTPLAADEVPTVSIAPSGQVTWAYPAGFELKPGQSLRVRTGFQVAAGASGQLVNVVATPVATAAGCPIDTYDAEAGLCTSTHITVASAKGGVLVEALSSASLGVTNQTGGTGDCIVATDPGFTKFPCAAVAPTGSTFEYRAKLTNNGADAFSSVTLADKLPGIADSALTVGPPVGLRFGEFASVITSTLEEFAFERVSATGVVTTIDPSLVQSFTSSGVPCALDVDASAASACAAGDWTAWTSGAAPAAATGVQFTFDLSANPLAAGETVRVTWSMDTLEAPVETALDTTDFRGGAADGRVVQWNTIAGAATSAAAASTVFAGESSKAGVTLSVARLLIDKTLVDERTVPSDGLEIFDFTLVCVVGDETVADTEFSIAAADLVAGPVELEYFVPVGADCTVTETDSAGATASPVRQTVTIVDGEENRASIVNTFIDTPGSISVAKKVTGTAPAGSVFEFTITRVDVEGEEPIVVTLEAGETLEIGGLPVGAEYEVEETESRGADSIAYEGLSEDGTVMVDDETVVITVNNTYNPVAIAGVLGMTGQQANYLLLIIALLGIAGGAGAILIRRRAAQQ